MGALATSKSTHISVVVPMAGFVLCTAFCFYILFDERYRQDQGTSPAPFKDEHESEVADAKTVGTAGEVRESTGA